MKPRAEIDARPPVILPVDEARYRLTLLVYEADMKRHHSTLFDTENRSVPAPRFDKFRQNDAQGAEQGHV